MSIVNDLTLDELSALHAAITREVELLSLNRTASQRNALACRYPIFRSDQRLLESEYLSRAFFKLFPSRL
jgi:hypothetical protein